MTRGSAHRAARATMVAALLTVAASRAHGQDVPKDVHWVRDAAEHDALFLQVYRGATARVDELASGLDQGSWAVIMDGDETVLDNSEHFRRAALQTGGAEESFASWARGAAAAALPGSAAFIAHVKDLGGRVVIVTNRVDEICDATRRNFAQLGLAVDAVLCRTGSSEDKNPRYEAVQKGTTGTGLPALRVLLWIGDNIQDFPGLVQREAKSRGEAALGDFGVRFFLLPNPMYGSWESSPAR